MNFLVLRRLKHSELGMFHAYRDLGKEGSKQRAINFDGDVVDRIFPSAKDTDQIFIVCKYQKDASSIEEVQQWLKRQDKNWRLEGNCPKSRYYDFVSPDCLFAMSINAGVTPAKASWIVIPENHEAHRQILDHGESGGLDSAGMISLYGDEGKHVRRVLGEHFPSLFDREPEQMTATPSTTGYEPHPLGTFNILANSGHDLPSAIADLVDNSITAGATEITITFPNPNAGGRWLCLRDNGKGMTSTELGNAMRIGNPKDYDAKDLGRFGFGLKGASWSQADTMTVIAKHEGKVAHLTWDKSHLEKTGKWSVLSEPIAAPYQDAADIPGKAGTAVLLTNMRPPVEMPTARDVDPYNVELGGLRAHLGLVFHRFLAGNARGRSTVAITINGENVLPNNPVAHPLTTPHNQRQIQLLNGTVQSNISLQAFVIPTEDQILQHLANDPVAARKEQVRLSLGGRMNASQGLYFYRLDRLIKWGGWCGVFTEDEHTKLLRVEVDFDRSADELMKVNISKREVQLSVKLKEAIKDAVKDARTAARDRYAGKPKAKRSSTPAPAGQAPAGGKTATPATPGGPGPAAGGGKKAQPAEPKVDIRIVASDKQWQLGTGFLGERTVQISEAVKPLVALAQAIESNPDAKHALAEFLNYLDGQPHA